MISVFRKHIWAADAKNRLAANIVLCIKSRLLLIGSFVAAVRVLEEAFIEKESRKCCYRFRQRKCEPEHVQTEP